MKLGGSVRWTILVGVIVDLAFQVWLKHENVQILGGRFGASFPLDVLLICAGWIIAEIADRTVRYLLSYSMPFNRLVKFGLVGAINTVVDLGVLNALLYMFSHGGTHGRLFPVFATVSFCCATLNSFYWNRMWTFKRESAGGARELSKFYAVTLASFVVNVGLSTLLVWAQPFPFLGQTLWANIAKVLATGVSLLMNFMGYDRLVFRKP